MIPVESLEQRINTLERKHARTRGVLWLAIGCLGASVGLNYAYATHRTLTVRELLLKDQEGRVRASLGTNPDGRPLLTLRDDAERPGITLGYSVLQKPGINVGLFGPRTRIGFGEQGLPVVALQDDAGQAHVELTLQPESRGAVTINGADVSTGSVSP